jgi:hypothetical protein
MAIDTFSGRMADVNTGNTQANPGSAKVAILGGATRIVPSNGVVVLPEGVALDQIHVLGRDLVVNLPDGGQMVIVDGAINIPQIVIGEVQLPAANVAALLIGQEPEPAAGAPSSGGGSFTEVVGDIGDPFGIGDLLPPTELAFTEPTTQEIFPEITNKTPTIDIEVDDSGVSVINAVDAVREEALPARGDEPEGSNSELTSEATFGFINISVPDAPGTLTINGIEITTVGQTITTPLGVLTIVSISPTQVGYSYLLTDDTLTAASDDFTVVISDADGDTATATLKINIVDDVPTAVNDTDSVADGSYAAATGNVITDTAAGDTGDSDNGADTVGADNAQLSAIASNNVPANSDNSADGSGNFVVNGQYGVLTINEDGSYSYTRSAGTPGGVTETFTYTLTDGDGDNATATLTINIGDIQPITGENATVQLDDDALGGGISGGTGDDTDAANISGTLTGAGGDGALTWAYETTGAPAGFTYVTSGDDLLIYQGNAQTGTLVLTITLDPATGDYTVTQNAPIAQAAGLDENNQLFTINYTVSDQDSDSTPGTLNISIDDDSPTLGVTQSGEGDIMLTTQDGDTIDAASDTDVSTADFGGVFGLTQNAGADGLGTAGTLSFELNVTNSTSGLASHGAAINLFDIGGKIVGSTAATAGDVTTGNTIFDLVVNGSGVVTLTQYQQIDHGSELTTDAPFADQLAVLADGKISLTASATVTDYDGDTATDNETVDLGGNIKFADHGPTLDVTKGTETGVVLTTQDGDTIDAASDTDVSTANFGGVFGLTQNAGADGLGTAGTLSFDLNVTDADSDLSSHGAAINLFDIGGKIVGSTAATAGDVTTGNTIFDLAVNGSGVVTLTQYQQIDHGSELTTDAPFADQLAVLADGKISLTASATVTDYDGDTATDSETVDLGGNIKFADHGPTIDLTLRSTGLVVDESVGTAGSVLNEGGATNNDETLAGAASGAIGYAKGMLFDITTANAGADGQASRVYSLSLGSAGLSGLVDSDTNQNVVLTLVSGVIEGRTATGGDLVFTLSINSGTGEVSLNQFRAIEHNDSADHDENGASAATLLANAISLNVTLSDYDGDTASDTLDISGLIKFEDDGPAVLSSSNASLINGGTFSGSGTFSYDIGSDHRAAPSTTNSDFQSVVLSGTINGSAITPSALTRVSETLTSATFSFSFSYAAGGQTLSDTGTIVFDKALGTYTVDLDSQVQGYSFGTTSQSTFIQGYTEGTDTVDATQPAVAIAQISTNLFIQFTGESVSGSNSLQAGSPGANGDALTGDATFVNGEVLTGNDSWASVSGSANGVAGDTIGKGEVLDMDFFTSNPGGHTDLAATAEVNNVFFKLDGIGNNEDFVVVLKLHDTVTNEYTTKAVLVENADIWKGPGTGPGIYNSVTLDNNDGLVIIESNDYNSATSHYVIVGMQVASDNGNMTGPAIDLNKAIGDLGGSTDVQNLTDDVNDTGFKVSDIGLVQTTNVLASGALSFNVTIVDADGDTSSQILTATLAAPVVTPVALDMDGDHTVSYLGLEAGVHYDYAGDGTAENTAWVAGNDGLLALRHADGSLQIQFSTQAGETDLEGLAKVYDTNHDGVLNAADTDFASFGVWQDADSDGAVDAGEFTSLSDSGIVAINLVSDGQVTIAADGDVIVFGETTYTKADGSSSTVADVGFVTSTATNDNIKAEQTSLNGSISNALLAASLVAMIDPSDSNAQPVITAEPVTEEQSVTTDSNAVNSDDSTDSAPSATADSSTLLDSNSTPVISEAAHHSSSDEGHDAVATGFEQAADVAHQVISDLLDQSDISPALFHFAQAVAVDAPANVAMEAVLIQQQADGQGGAPAQLGEVLADALSGGAGQGPSIDHLLDALAGTHEGVEIAAMLTNALGGQPGNIPELVTALHVNFNDMMDHFTAHPDAIAA